jgi:hypothetical protein
VGATSGRALAGASVARSELLGGRGGVEWPDYAAAATYVPVLQVLVEAATAFIAGTAALLLVVAALNRWTGGWVRRRTDATVTLIWLGLVLSGIGVDMRGTVAGDLLRWAGGGVGVGLALIAVYHLSRRFGASPIPVLVAVLLLASRWEEALIRPLESSVAAAAGATVLVGVAALFWSRALQRGRP